MNIVVTGGAGFIGANFVHHWLANYPKDNITVIDKLTYAGNLANLKPVKANINIIHADINDAAKIKDVINPASVIVHFAAESHVTRSEADPNIFETTNVKGTKNLLNLALNNQHLKKFIHISTDEVYGTAKDGHFFKEAEKQPGDAQATSAYAKSKSRADDIAKEFAKKMPLNIVRPTNNFGPYQHPEKMLPRSISRVITGKPIVVWGNGKQVRDWLYAKDTASAIDVVINSAAPGEIYNIGANNNPEIENKELAKWLTEYLSQYKPQIKYIEDPRPQHDFRYGVDTSKIKALGWQPTRDVWAALANTVDWYVKNKAWWAPLIKEAEAIYG